MEDYKTIPGWDNPYIQNHVVQPLQGALAVQDVELAYELPDAYFHIQTCKDSFDYTLYNKDFTERDGGILETDGDKEQERSNTKKSVLDALRSLKAKKQEQPTQEQDKSKKAKTKGIDLI